MGCAWPIVGATRGCGLSKHVALLGPRRGICKRGKGLAGWSLGNDDDGGFVMVWWCGGGRVVPDAGREERCVCALVEGCCDW